jgi:hypothetical protein
MIEVEPDRLDRFPMQNGPTIDREAARAIYEMYAYLYGRDQSLETIARRGGFGWAEVELIQKACTKKRGRKVYLA